MAWRTIYPDSAYWLRIDCVNITVQRRLEEEGWLLTCREVGYELHPLGTKCPEDAKCEALRLVRARVEDVLKAVDAAIKESEGKEGT